MIKKQIAHSKIVLKNVKDIQYLPCPICKTKNPVSRSNISLRCSNCKTRLLSIKVRKAKNK